MSLNKIITNTSIGCLIFFIDVFLILLILKLFDIITISWWFIVGVLFAPHIIGVFLVILALFIIQIYYLFIKYYGHSYEKKRKL